jgi:ATP-dependent Lon protease
LEQTEHRRFLFGQGATPAGTLQATTAACTIWVLSPGGLDEHPGLYRLDVTQGPGSGVKILNQPPPAPFKESLRCAEQNLYARAKTLVGDRAPQAHEFSVQLRAFAG